MKNRISQFMILNKIAVFFALGCFVIGGLLFILSFLIPEDYLLGFGVLFFFLAILGNGIFLICISVRLLLTKTYKENFFTLYCILINIPITIGYISIRFI
ncbi:hypothetical protein AAU57_13900 [Nonlabens sp. YIK11]|uniref:hypothetical protein n=1 Tax=Nonlabens sp. YIK11 TaxID=1453349 RepID=UPI0006DC16EE|nr:hypothetical protein [Nonlabens sp. YIK11]KQC34310.1 hypothetical protein AAU57_13900 [Nonlabens sp. YIK11]